MRIYKELFFEGDKSALDHLNTSMHIPQNLRIRSEGTERHSALN